MILKMTTLPFRSPKELRWRVSGCVWKSPKINAKNTHICIFILHCHRVSCGSLHRVDQKLNECRDFFNGGTEKGCYDIRSSMNRNSCGNCTGTPVATNLIIVLINELFLARHCRSHEFRLGKRVLRFPGYNVTFPLVMSHVRFYAVTKGKIFSITGIIGKEWENLVSSNPPPSKWPGRCMDE